MSHVYTPSAVAVTSTTLPDDGDLASAASVNTPFEDALDGVKYCQNALDGTSSGTVTPADINVASGSLIANGTEVSCGVQFISAAAAQCNSTLTVVGAATFSSTSHHVGAVTCASTLAATGNLSSSATVSGATLLVTGAFQASSSGVICSKLLGVSAGIAHREYLLPNSNATVNVSDGDVFVVPNISADRSYTMGTVGAVDGQWVKFVANDATNGSFKATVFYGATSTQMGAHAPLAGVTMTTSLELRMRGGVWQFETRVPWY
jgi:hypothetical protein